MDSNLPAIAVSLMLVTMPLHKPASAAQDGGCFVGRDHTGGQALMQLASERYGDYYEVYGSIVSNAIGRMQIKADGWSGAGRMFYNHEYESGAIYIQISNYDGSGFLFSVDGYGDFRFRRSRC